MKKILKKLAIYLTTIIAITGLNFAILEISDTANTANAGTAAPIEDLLPQKLGPEIYNIWHDDDKDAQSQENQKQLESYIALTNKPLPDILASVIKTMLYLVASLTVVSLIVIGVLFLTGSMTEDNISKAKKILGYIGIGIIIISASYGVISGILELDFFT
ncbi:MAG TPA: hypothetical protein PK398_00670 [Candidatus Gracilibacteria bacterium]|nr:hypothetical protein [Candidatus Gracilibacteria bacterium]